MTTIDHERFLSDGGEMGARMRAHDWSTSPLGEPTLWPDSLKPVVSLMLASKFPMFLLWGDQHCCLYNDGYIPLLGRRHPAALGRPYIETWPEIWSFIHPMILRARAGESVYFERLPLRVQRNEFEEEASFTFSYSPLRDAQGDIRGMFCACMETTEQLRAETSLRESEARWRGLFNNMQEGFFLAQALRDDDGRMTDFRFLEMNPGFEIQSGIGAAAAIGRPARKVLPGLQDELIRRYVQVVDSGEPSHFEVHIPVLGDRWFEVRARKTATDQFAALLLDITARKGAEAALRKSEATFRGLTQSIPNHVWTAAPNGMLDWFNDRAYDYTGARFEDMAGTAWASVVHRDDIAAVSELWAQSIQQQIPYQAEFRLRRFDGSYRWHITRAAPIYTDNGMLERWIGTNTDIEDQKHSEQELARLNDTLESRVAERSTELEVANEALRQAQKMEVVGQLTGGIAHDFNNLLTGVIGGLDMLRTRLAQGRHDDVERYVEAVATSAQRAAALTHRLLAFSRRQPLKPEVVDANALVRAMLDLFERTLGSHVALEVVECDELWPTLCDANQLESALLNLVINARDAIPHEGRLTIETGNLTVSAYNAARHPGLGPGDYISLAVADTGRGMPAAVMNRAFEPFFTTKPAGEGTGLGLSMTYGFVKQSHGHIEIRSEIGKGTRITLYLPRYNGSQRSGERQRSHDAELALVTSNPHSVLVVEDEPVIRALILEVLNELGYRCQQAGDGLAALKLLKSGAPIDLLITDVGLPGLNGRQLATQARQLQPQLKILFITGYAEDATFDRASSQGSMEMLPKPFGVKELVSTIQSLLRD
ncbi:MAG: PAS domain S-box protein [Rhodanobacter sp.]